VLLGGYFSFGQNMPHMLALRDPINGVSDIAMTIGQIGLFVGISVAIVIRIKSNADFVESFIPGKDTGPFVKGLVKFGSALIPLCIALSVEKEVLSLISIFSSLLCPYFIIIIPGMVYLVFF
jgi:hypothetical protein